MNVLTGSILKAERKRREMSQKDLAELIGISPAYINLIENGHRPLTAQLQREISLALDIKASRLAGEDNRFELERLKVSPHFSGQDREVLERIVVEMPSLVQDILQLEENFALNKIALERVSNRIETDEHLSNSIHDLLSLATSMRSTSSILNTQGDLTPDHSARFRDALDQDARSLSDQLRGLVTYLDKDAKSNAERLKGELRLIQYCEDHRYYFEDLEEGRVPADGLFEWLSSKLGQELAESGQVQRLFLLFLRDIERLPRDDFVAVAERVKWNVLELSHHFDCAVDRVLRRIAMLSRFGTFDQMVLYIQDQTGVFLLESLNLSGHRTVELDCPFWPIFDCERERGRIFPTQISTGPGEPYHALAAAGLTSKIGRSKRPWIYRSMIVYQNHELELLDDRTRSVRYVGFNCRECRIHDCDARRNHFIPKIENKNNREEKIDKSP